MRDRRIRLKFTIFCCSSMSMHRQIKRFIHSQIRLFFCLMISLKTRLIYQLLKLDLQLAHLLFSEECGNLSDIAHTSLATVKLKHSTGGTRRKTHS